MKQTRTQFPMKRKPSKSKFLSVLTRLPIARTFIVCLTLSAIAWPAWSATPPILKESEKMMVGHRVADFTLKDLEGHNVALSKFSDKPIVVLFVMGKGCPVANLYLTELRQLQETYDKKGLQIIGIDSNSEV